MGGTARAAAISEPAALTFDEVLGSVMAEFPLLRAAERERDAADGELLAARGAFDPAWRTRFGATPFGYYETLRLDTWIEQPTPIWGATLFGGYRLGLGKFADYDGKLATNDGGELRAGVAIPLWRNGPIDRRRANIRRAELGRKIADLALTQQQLDSLRAAAMRYWEWVAAGRRLVVAQRLLEISLLRDAAIATRVERGDIPALEKTENARAILSREAQVVAAERAFEQAAIELSMYLRDDKGRPVRPEISRLPAAFPEPSAAARAVEDDARAALVRRPEARRLSNVGEQARVELGWAKNQLAPAVDVTAAVSYDLGDGSPTRSRPELEAGVFIEVPVLTRAARGRIQSAEAQVRRAEAQASFARDRIVADVRDADSALRAAARRVEVARREVAAADELERAERRRFDAGEGTLLFVNLREQATAEARLREVDALADWHRAAAAYAAATATLVPDA